MGLRTFTAVGGLLWYKCSAVCESPTQQLMGFDFTLIVPLLASHCGFSYVFRCGVSFLVSSSVLLSIIVQQLVVILVFSQEGVRARPSICHLGSGLLFCFLFWVFFVVTFFFSFSLVFWQFYLVLFYLVSFYLVVRFLPHFLLCIYYMFFPCGYYDVQV